MAQDINEYIEKIKEYLKDPETRRYVIGGAILVVALIYIFIAVVPTFKNAVVSSKNAKDLKRKMDILDKRVKGLSEMDKKLEQMRAENKAYSGFLPYQKDFPELLNGLASIAENSGVTIRSIIPGKLTKIGSNKNTNKYFRSMPVSISAKSSYHQLGKFMSNLKTANRFILLENLNIVYTSKTPRLHDVKIGMKTYVSIEE